MERGGMGDVSDRMGKGIVGVGGCGDRKVTDRASARWKVEMLLSIQCAAPASRDGPSRLAT